MDNPTLTDYVRIIALPHSICVVRENFPGHGSTRINTDLIVNGKEKSVKSVFFRVPEI